MNKIKELYKKLIMGERPDLALWAFPVVGLLILCLLPYLLTRKSLSFIDYTYTGQIGDTIGGIAGPVIAIFAALLTFLAFWIQVQANKVQTAQFKKQDIDTKIDRFENKFYELLRLHKENVDEISINGYDQRKIEKRKAFVSLYREFKNAFFVIKIKYQQLHEAGQLDTFYNDEELLRLSYIFFYAGVGIHSDDVNMAMVGNQFDPILYNSVKNDLKKIQDTHKQKSKAKQLPELEIEGLGKSMVPKSYRPFIGHESIFGHYYRHLFQSVKFVVNQSDDFINFDQKLEYLRTLRAQLSDHEQVMLYYNAIVGFGKDWIDNDYFTNYKMIHNLPLPLANFGIAPQKKFQEELDEGMDLFEWHST
jgi:hypothetical protein